MAPFAVWLRRRGPVLATVLLAGVVALAAGLLWRHHTAPARQEAAQRPAPSQPLAPPKVDYARLHARITRLMQEPDMVGLAVAAVERGKVRFVHGYGVTQAGSTDPVTPDTVFRWASLSKGVAAALVVQLAEEGRLSLDAPLSSLGTSLTLPAGGQATVADLLSHRLGLSHNAWDDRLEAGADPKLLRAELGTLPQACPPGTCHAYQNVAFDTASEIVEHAAGRPYAEVARERLFGPLGMTSATIGRAGLEASASWARPHHFRKTPATVKDAYYRVPAAGGVNTSIKDLARWMQAQMGEAPEVLSPAALVAMHKARVATPPRGPRGPDDLKNAAYGLGWRSFTYDGHTLVGHRGSVDGYNSLILFDPVDRSGIVMLWNANYYRPARLELEFFDSLYGLPPTDRMQLDDASKPKAPATAAKGRRPRAAHKPRPVRAA